MILLNQYCNCRNLLFSIFIIFKETLKINKFKLLGVMCYLYVYVHKL